MPEKTAGNLLEIRTYIKGMSQLGLKATDIYKEVGDIYGKDQMSFITVYRWVAKSKSGLQQDAGRPATTATKRNILKMCNNK